MKWREITGHSSAIKTPPSNPLGTAGIAAGLLAGILLPFGIGAFLAELTQTTGETSNLTEPVHGDMLYAARFVGSKFSPIHLPIGSRIPMYCTASGSAYLSALDDEDVLALLQASDLSRHTQFTRITLDEILAEIAEVRRKGDAINSEELFLGDVTVAAVVCNS